MFYSHIAIEECIREFLLFDLAYVCNADSQSVELELERAE